jgi:DbpA RNA binding domain
VRVERSRHVVLVTPPAVEQAAAVWELVSAGTPALFVCLDHTVAADWADLASRPPGLRVHAVTSLGRTAALLKLSPPDVLAGAPEDLAALAAMSLLKLDAVVTVVLAWPESSTDPAPGGALDTLLAETRHAARVVLSWNPPALADLLERHAHRAEVIGELPLDSEGRSPGPIGPAKYAVTPAGRRAGALREVADALRAVQPVIWSGGDIPASLAGDALLCSVLPTRAQFTALAKLAAPVLLLTPAQLPYARTIAAPLTPVALSSGADRGLTRVDRLRGQVANLIDGGRVDTELAALAPLFERYDAAEVAAALFALSRKEPAGDAEGPAAAPAPQWVKLFVSVGKKDGAGAKDLVGALIREAGLARDDLGRIELRETFSLVDIAPTAVERAIAGLTGKTIRGRRVQVRRERS